MIYWLLDETPEETPGFCGYSFGAVEGKEQVPDGATTFETEAELNEQIAATEKKIAEEQENQEPPIRTQPGQIGR